MHEKKIFLTGDPHSGKTTLLKKVLEAFPEKKGFYTEEIKDSNGNRVRFEVVTSDDKRTILADKTHPSDITHSSWQVHIEGMDRLLSSLLQFPPQTVLYVDEVGTMQLHSSIFKEILSKYLRSENVFIGTFKKNYAEPFIKKIMGSIPYTVYEVTNENRTALHVHIQAALEANQ